MLEPLVFVSSSISLRQGNPLSPLLLILVMKTLSKLVNKAVGEGFLDGFQISSFRTIGLLTSHLFFAMIPLFFVSQMEVVGLFEMQLFEAMFGLRVNLSKCALVTIGEVPYIHVLARFFGCGVDYLHFSYLRLPLGTSYKSTMVWDLVIERFHERLAGWKSKLMFRGADEPF